MKGLSPKQSSSHNRRSKPTCSFCRNPNHRVGDCPHVAVIWESLQKGIIPLDYMKTVQDNDTSEQSRWRTGNVRWTSPLSTYYSKGVTWGDLFTITEKSYEKWLRNQNRTKTTKGKRKKLSTCGYCKETGHTRTKCSHLDTHKKMLVRANRNFRQWFYEEYVEKQGLSTGCIVAFDYVVPASYNTTSTSTPVQTIVTDINWDSINLLTMLDLDSASVKWSTEVDGKKSDALNNIRDFMRSKVLMKVPSQALSKCDIQEHWRQSQSTTSYGIELPLRTMTLKSGYHQKHNVLTNFESMERIGYSNNRTENGRIVQRAPQVLASDWVDGYSDEMSVIFKKFTRAQLEFFGVIEHIKTWAYNSDKCA